MSRSNRDTTWPPEPEPLPVGVIDNHTHLESIPDVLGPGDPVPSITEHIQRAQRAGVVAMVQIGCDLDSARATTQMVDQHPQLLGGVALHPNEAPLHAGIREVAPDGLVPDPQDRHRTPLDEAIAQIADLARNDRIRVIGETGLDYFRGGEQARKVQRNSFRDHIALAKELDLPLQIHDRDAHRDVIEVLLRDGAPKRTVFHCFSGDVEMAQVCVDNGWFLSFSGTITFRANNELREVARTVPLESILVETDAPYLTPHPFRGRPNAPYLVVETVRAVAQARGQSATAVAGATAATAQDLYGPW